jgi:hypothetical protein
MCDHPQAFRAVTRKARKDHCCTECGGLIAKGTEYEYHSGIWDHQPSSEKLHLDCNKLFNDVMRSDPYNDCLPYGSLYEAVGEQTQFGLRWKEIKERYPRYRDIYPPKPKAPQEVTL